MAKYELDDRQCRIIRRGLENLYYICKDEGDTELMSAITELESSLNSQYGKHLREREQMLDRIHDCYYDCIGEPPTDEQVKEIAPKIEEELKHEAEQWGWDDTEVNDRIWNWINENIKHG